MKVQVPMTVQGPIVPIGSMSAGQTGLLFANFPIMVVTVSPPPAAGQTAYVKLDTGQVQATGSDASVTRVGYKAVIAE